MTRDENAPVFGTISAVDIAHDRIEIRIEDGKDDVTLPLKFGKASKAWYESHIKQFPIGQVVEFVYKAYGPNQVLGKMKPAQQRPTPAQRSNEIIVNEKLKQAGLVPNPENKDYSQNQFPATSGIPLQHPGGQTTTTGLYDPKCVTIKMRTTCPTPTQYENIAIEVEGPDPETCRRALIDAYSILGTAHAPTKDFINAHIKRVLLEGE